MELARRKLAEQGNGGREAWGRPRVGHRGKSRKSSGPRHFYLRADLADLGNDLKTCAPRSTTVHVKRAAECGGEGRHRLLLPVEEV